MLLHMVAVLTIVGMYCTELRGYPRITAGWLMVPTSVTMAATTFLTTRFHRRSLRHVWLIVGLVGSAACVWWMSSIDNFTAKERMAVMLACWGAFLGLIPPVFLTDEIEGIDPKDMLYAGAIGIVGLVVPIITVPTATGTVVREWSDRARDVYRHNLRENRPAVEQASARVADYFHQRGLSGAALQQETSRVLGGFVTFESIAHGFRSGLRFLSLMMLGIGLAVAIGLARSAQGIAGAARVGLHLMCRHAVASASHRIGSSEISVMRVMGSLAAVGALIIAAASAMGQDSPGNNTPRRPPSPAAARADTDVVALFRFEPTGLSLLRPYQRGRIPVVLIHGLWSNPWSWARMIESFESDAALSERYQFWTFGYSTGDPLPHSAALLRETWRRHGGSSIRIDRTPPSTGWSSWVTAWAAWWQR